jgi:hypothetical protein
MTRGSRLLAALAGGLAACSGATPSTPTSSTLPAATAPAPPVPTAAPLPAATPTPAPLARNEPPVISGLDTCVGEAGMEHVFDLTLSDPDDDAIEWRASREEPRGLLEPTSGPLVPSGTAIQIRYRPPGGTEENRIRVFATDARGATTRMILYVRNN